MSNELRPFRRRSPLEVGVMILVFAFLLAIIYSLLGDEPPDIITNYCAQPSIIPLKGNFLNSSEFFTTEYHDYSLQALQGAIQVRTESFDDMDMDPTKDRRFDIFYELHKYLFKTFPLTASHVETVNELGLLYTFEGKDSSLKPVVLMAHQDVVPVPDATLDQWDYPPFQAHYDGEWLYGRGTADTKDSLVGILEAVESLVDQGWKPERTLILSFGFDEEISGYRGASTLAKTIEERYGKDGVEMVVDEGFGMQEYYGALVGNVLVAEKGYVDLEASLITVGGHSSVPPDHTGIGIMSRLVKKLESRPFSSDLENANPTLSFFRCLAEHAPNMDKEFRRTILDIEAEGHRDRLVSHIDQDIGLKYTIRTSQAADIIKGGTKLNALPERVDLKVNHRISPSSGTVAVIERFEAYIMQIAEEFRLGVVSHDKTLIEPTDKGYFNITASRNLEPAPISPHSGIPWDLVGSTTRSILEARGFTEPLVMAPALMQANTDTRYYWDLTRAIYRFKPVLAEDCINYHTVNEKLRFRSHLISVAWFYEFIINATL